MLVNFNEMLKQARKNNYAVPHFNINNLEWTRFILEKCESLKIPVILGVSPSTAKYMGGWSVCYNLVTSLLEELTIKIPVCLHVDHGTEEDCIMAIESGFTSVMIDASKYSLDKNIEITKRVTEYAHKNNVSVEAEIGYISTNTKNEIEYASVENCKKLYEATKIDALAPAIGNIHGIYLSKPKLDFNLLSAINRSLNIPLVLHGGSGLAESDFKSCIKNGIAKININTDLQLSWYKGITDFIAKNPDIYDPRKIISSGKQQFNDKIEELVSIFETKKVADL